MHIVLAEPMRLLRPTAALVALALTGCLPSGNTTSTSTSTVTAGIAPAVTNISPVEAGTSSSRGPLISITFDSPIDPTTAIAANISLSTGATTYAIGGVSRAANDTHTLHIWPQDTLPANTAITVTVSTAVHDTDGDALAGSYSWTFTTPATPSWGMAQRIDSSDAYNSLAPRIGMDSSGNAIALWQHWDNSNAYSIYSSRYAAATGTWSAAAAIESSTELTETPALTVLADGTAYAAWRERLPNGHFNIFASPFNGTSWGTAVNVMNLPYNADMVTVAATTGSAIAVWRQEHSTQTRYGIWSSRYDGANWDVPRQLDSNQYDANQPQLAMRSDGSALAVWQQYNGTTLEIFGADYTPPPANAWNAATRLSSASTTVNASQPQLVLGATTSAAAFWVEYDNSGYRLMYALFNGTVWGTPQTLRSTITPISLPHAVSNAGGAGIVVWQENDGTHHNTLAQRFNVAAAGVTLNGGVTALESLTDSAATPQASINAGGDILVVWRTADTPTTNVWGNRYDATAASWSGAEKLEVVDSGSAYEASAAINSSGEAVVIWRAYNGVNYKVYANHYQ